MKKVLISAYTCCPDRGSEPGNGWNWIINYARCGYDLEVFTSGKYKKEIETYQHTHRLESIKFHFIDSTVKLKTLQIPAIGIYAHYFLWLAETRRRICRLDLQQFTHCHHITYSSIKFGTPLYNLQVPVIIGPMGGAESTDSSLRKYFGKHWSGEKIKEEVGNVILKWNWSAKKSIDGAALVLVSNSHTDRAVKNISSRAKTSPMFDAGLAEYFRLGPPNVKVDGRNEIIVLWTGRMLPRKGLNLAIEGFGHLLSMSNSNFKLRVIGDGPLLGECKELAAELGISQNVEFLGKLGHSEVVAHYQNADVFLFPSLKDSCPMQVFEAMAAGLPVVTLNHQGMADQVTSATGIKVSVGANVNYAKELAEAILTITENGDRYIAYQRAAYMRGQDQIWGKRIENFLNTLDSQLAAK